MKTKFQLAALLLGLATINAPLSTCFAQGSLTPPGAPAVGMKSLDQIYARGDARISITNSASLVTISAPGSYYLTTNLTVSSGDGIVIATNGVTLDLNGYTIRSTAASAAGYAIRLTNTLRNITIANGFIESGVTNNGSGIYSGSGFGYGIYYSGSVPANVLVARVSVAGCRYHGIYLGLGDATVVENSTARTMGSYCICASTIKQSAAVDCAGYAIYGEQVADCRGECTSSSYGVSATTAQNCYGYSSSGSGLVASTAQNCYGYSNSSGTGLYVGITALNCYGQSSSGYGLYASKTATGCYGYSSSGTGLYAFIGTSCSGSSLSITHNLNSF